MGKKTRKNAHRASKALEKSSKSEKDEILKRYSELDKEEVSQEPDYLEQFIQSAKGEVQLQDILEQLRSDSSDLVIDALKQFEKISDRADIDSEKAHPVITNILKGHLDEKVRYEATKALSKIKDLGDMADLLHVINTDKSEHVREGAVKALGLIKATGCSGYLADILNDVWNQSIRVRKAAAFALGRLDPKVSINILSDSLINDPDRDVRRESAEALAVCFLKLEKDKVSLIVETILTQLDHNIEKEHEVRLSVLNAVTVAEDPGCIDVLITVLRTDPYSRVRGKAANTLVHFFDPRVERALIESLGKEEGGVKKRIALAIAHYAMRNPLGLHDEICNALIYIQKHFPRGSYVWKEAVKALPAY